MLASLAVSVSRSLCLSLIRTFLSLSHSLSSALSPSVSLLCLHLCLSLLLFLSIFISVLASTFRNSSTTVQREDTSINFITFDVIKTKQLLCRIISTCARMRTHAHINKKKVVCNSYDDTHTFQPNCWSFVQPTHTSVNSFFHSSVSLLSCFINRSSFSKRSNNV